jgi:heme/copper-type cytochrome/quinol oxidase subunit 3
LDWAFKAGGLNLLIKVNLIKHTLLRGEKLMSATKNHPYHIVDPSPWPFLSSMAAFFLVSGIILWIRDFGPWVMIGATGLLIYTLWNWWKDVTDESMTEGLHPPIVRQGFRYGMVFFIASEVMFFAVFFWAYFNAGINPSESIGSVWPPKGLQTFDPYQLPLLNTVILLLSGTTVTWAHHLLIDGDSKGAVEKTAYTVLLGMLFTVCQAFEYMHAPFSLSENIYTSAFFIATGFHGAHVIIGTIFLAVCYKRLEKGHFTKDDHFGFEAAAWYWHFVDVVWLFLFFSIYIWGYSGIVSS